MTDDAARTMVHTPYDLGVGINIGQNRDTYAFFRTLWYSGNGNMTAIFELPDGHEPYLVVEFHLPEIVRVLDEFWISTETPDKWAGDLTSFCRTVEGAVYPTNLEWARETRPKAVLYQFVTNDQCLEVMSEHPPIARLSSEASMPAFANLD